MSNRFRDSIRRKLYDDILDSYRQKTNSLFMSDGSRRLVAGGMSAMFWRGYDNALVWDTSSKRMLGYVCYRAGEDARRYTDAGCYR